VLHGEQYTEVLNPIPTSGTLVSTFKVSAVLDKKSGAVLVVDVVSKDKATGIDILKNQV
jgi:3-hydroxyacyl-CoA dehydrogenase/3a,7a,12a-trihydroxy-5b-cholest-24-enoyl-CoA hydratase